MNAQIEKNEVTLLVLQAQAGNSAAFGELCQRFQRHIMAVALRRLGDFADAEELCQDVFVQAMLKIGQLRQPEAFAGWIRAITIRMAINKQLRRTVDVSFEQEALEATYVQEETPLDTAIEVEEHFQLREGLGRLGETDRQTLEAFYVRGQSLNEMSDEFEAPVGTIKRRLHVARKRLAKEVEDLVAV